METANLISIMLNISIHACKWWVNISVINNSRDLTATFSRSSVHVFGHKGGFNETASAPTKRICASSNSLPGKPEKNLDGRQSPDGRHIVSGSADRTIQVWDAQTGDHPWQHFFEVPTIFQTYYPLQRKYVRET